MYKKFIHDTRKRYIVVLFTPPPFSESSMNTEAYCEVYTIAHANSPYVGVYDVYVLPMPCLWRSIILHKYEYKNNNIVLREPFQSVFITEFSELFKLMSWTSNNTLKGMDRYPKIANDL